MKKWKRKIAAVLLCAMMCMTFTACASAESDKAYPIELDGTEIIVGTTTLSTLFTAGYEIMAVDGQSVGMVEAYTPLEKDSYYSGLFIQEDGQSIAMLHIATGSEDVTASEAVIAQLTFTGYNDEPLNTDRIKFDGVTLTDLTPEVFMEHVPAGKTYEDGSGAYFHGSDYGVSITYENGVPVKFEIERKYDVEW